MKHFFYQWSCFSQFTLLTFKMDDSGNEIIDGDEDRVSRVLEQWEIDEINMKDLSAANRLFRKCASGKCPPLLEKVKKIDMVQVKPKKKKKKQNFTSSKFHDKKLSQIWITTGRDHRYKVLEGDLRELDIKIKVATGRTHLKDHEKNFKAITLTITEIESIDEQTKKAELEITHLKSQFPRLTKKRDELSLETESEGDEKYFSDNEVS